MRRWIKTAAALAIVVVMAITCLGMYVTWQECSARGGKTVRGIFGLVCVT